MLACRVEIELVQVHYNWQQFPLGSSKSHLDWIMLCLIHMCQQCGPLVWCGNCYLWYGEEDDPTTAIKHLLESHWHWRFWILEYLSKFYVYSDILKKGLLYFLSIWKYVKNDKLPRIISSVRQVSKYDIWKL